VETFEQIRRDRDREGLSIQQGRRVRFTTLAGLANELQEAEGRRESISKPCAPLPTRTHRSPRRARRSDHAALASAVRRAASLASPLGASRQHRAKGINRVLSPHACSDRGAPHRTAPHRTAPHRIAPHRTAATPRLLG
jgi:hypothetical protein